MARFFASGHAVGVVLAVMLGELIMLVGRWRWRASDALLRLGPGVLMTVALGAATTGAAWYWIALPLLASFPVHVADLMRRGSRPGG